MHDLTEADDESLRLSPELSHKSQGSSVTSIPESWSVVTQVESW